ncbi:MAG: TauD/TfdA family dioxygenase [Nocardioides sp.]|uniref:TauD/TfdA dioxygenase family protein n=1 Tax=Nocardioides sp. TaxID=35761 RepID=UPI0039E3BE86
MTQLDQRPAAASRTESADGTTTYDSGLVATKVGGSLGAVVSGVRIGADLDPQVVADFRDALLTHKVVFLRDQQHAGDVEQYDFAAQLGEVTSPHPTVKGDGRAVLPIDSERGKANSWHTDVTFVDRIPAISVLRAITLPPYGGTTVWANTVRAYQRLAPALKELVGGLRAVHSNQYDYAIERPQIGGIDVKEESYREEFRNRLFLTEHPLVRIHPETGEPSLLLGHFAQSITGLSSHDFHDLYTLLQRHVTALENTVRWSWQPGDVAIWDNRATQHYAVADYDEHARLLHRITIAGDVPVGINGDVSRVIQGDASGFSSLDAPAA